MGIVYLRLTPEQAVELAAKLQRVARDVLDAANNRDVPNAYEYLTLGKTEYDTTLRVRVGS